MNKLLAAIVVVALAVTMVAYEPAPAPADAAWDNAAWEGWWGTCNYPYTVHITLQAKAASWVGDTWVFTRRIEFESNGGVDYTRTVTANKFLNADGKWYWMYTTDTGFQSIKRHRGAVDVGWPWLPGVTADTYAYCN